MGPLFLEHLKYDGEKINSFMKRFYPFLREKHTVRNGSDPLNKLLGVLD